MPPFRSRGVIGVPFLQVSSGPIPVRMRSSLVKRAALTQNGVHTGWVHYWTEADLGSALITGCELASGSRVLSTGGAKRQDQPDDVDLTTAAKFREYGLALIAHGFRSRGSLPGDLG